MFERIDASNHSASKNDSAPTGIVKCTQRECSDIAAVLSEYSNELRAGNSRQGYRDLASQNYLYHHPTKNLSNADIEKEVEKFTDDPELASFIKASLGQHLYAIFQENLAKRFTYKDQNIVFSEAPVNILVLRKIGAKYVGYLLQYHYFFVLPEGDQNCKAILGSDDNIELLKIELDFGANGRAIKRSYTQEEMDRIKKSQKIFSALKKEVHSLNTKFAYKLPVDISPYQGDDLLTVKTLVEAKLDETMPMKPIATGCLSFEMDKKDGKWVFKGTNFFIENNAKDLRIDPHFLTEANTAKAIPEKKKEQEQLQMAARIAQSIPKRVVQSFPVEKPQPKKSFFNLINDLFNSFMSFFTKSVPVLDSVNQQTQNELEQKQKDKMEWFLFNHERSASMVVNSRLNTAALYKRSDPFAEAAKKYDDAKKVEDEKRKKEAADREEQKRADSEARKQAKESAEKARAFANEHPALYQVKLPPRPLQFNLSQQSQIAQESEERKAYLAAVKKREEDYRASVSNRSMFKS